MIVEQRTPAKDRLKLDEVSLEAYMVEMKRSEEEEDRRRRAEEKWRRWPWRSVDDVSRM